MSNFFFVTLQGVEDVLLEEVRSLNVQGSVACPGVVRAECSLKEAVLVGYRSQSVQGIFELFDEKDVREKSFSLESANASGQQVVREEWSARLASVGGKLQFRDPELSLALVTVEEKNILCRDCFGDLGKREYRVFLSRHALRPATVFSLVAKSAVNNSGVVCIPWCGDGLLGVELALWLSGRSPRMFEKERFSGYEDVLEAEDEKVLSIDAKIFFLDGEFRFVNGSRKNCVLAGVDKLVEFSRTPSQDIDFKFGKGEIDAVLCTPPVPSARSDPLLLWRTFFERLKKVHKKGGILGVVLMRGSKEFKVLALKQGYSLRDEWLVVQGGETVSGMVFVKG